MQSVSVFLNIKNLLIFDDKMLMSAELRVSVSKTQVVLHSTNFQPAQVAQLAEISAVDMII